ncbi:CDK5 regulatory subunit-associated protein 2 isoform X2 [Sceloporus undulatus]|uniref:CDK5 regulatory subunit-associated protein 2 isoform X2 n=1 Tax=Sceloporus undulatus TaxID=8520 RepID=UPI001C4A8169|nr:CDK5 regulatory subunit-associated protein 2 isoform X2 [Sceloporus undulatus]
MDSLPGEDPTLPLGLNGSVNFSQLPDVSGDEIRVRLGGGGVLPDVAEDAVSPTRARTMKDFENQIIELRKENFNLKLRIYFLEERIQQKFDGSNEDIYRINIELKVELESLKQELQEREQLLIKASKALESLAQGGDAEIQRLKEEAQKKVQEVEENLTSRINRLEEDLKMAHDEAEKAFAMTERERVLRLTAEQQLSLITNMQPRDLDVMVALEEKDRHREQQRLSLKNQEALIRSLEEAKSQRQSVEESLLAEKIQERTMALMREKEQELEGLRTEFSNEKGDLEKRIQSLQEELRERETELSVEKRNALKRDKTIQGLTLALKTRENENEELSSEIEGLTASLAKAREATHKVQMQKFKGAEDSQVLLLEKESRLADLRSENLTKDTENRKLQRRVKRAEQELSDLRLEKEMLVKELEETQLQKSRSDKSINDLRNQLEKTQDEMIEKEKAMEHHYSVLLSECNQKLQNQELVIARLTASIAQKDEMLQKVDGVVKEKDAGLQEWFVKFQSLAKNQEMLQKQNEELVMQKSAALAQQPILTMYEELEKTKAAEYVDMLEALRKERDIFSTLIKSLKEADGINDLQEEMSNILLLRKQLEEDILATWNLRKALEDQIKANRREEETISCWSDQTSYMSICLRTGDHLDLQIDNLSMEELKKKIAELLSTIKELHLENQELRKRQFDFSVSDSLAKESQKMLDNSEFLESPEASRTLTEGFDDETSMPSSQGPETVSEVIPSDYSDRQCRNLNKPGLKDEPAVGAGFPGSAVGEENEAQERRLLVSLFSENGRAVLASRQEEMKIANEPLDAPNTTAWDGSSDDLENRDEKDLKRLIIQLRAELKALAQVNKCQKRQLESQSTVAESEGLDREPALPQINTDIELSKVEVKDTATQTAAAEGSVGRLKHEGKIATWEDKAKSSRLNDERRQKRVSAKSKQQETPLRMSKTNKSDLCQPFKKSRLPVRMKPSRSLGSISSGFSPQKPDLHLQHRMFNLDEDLKGRCPQPNELHLSEAECRPGDQDQMLVGAESLIKLDGSDVDISFASVESKGKTSEKDQRTSQDESLLKLNASDIDVSLVSAGSQEGMSSKYQSTSQETESNKLEPDVPTSKELDQDFSLPSKQDVNLATVASTISLKLSCTSLEEFDCDTVDDVKELRQRVKDLMSELVKYHTLMTCISEPAKQPLPSVPLSVVQNHEELPADDHFPPTLEGNKHESQTFSEAPQKVEHGIQVEDLASRLLEEQNEAMVEKLKELLSENEVELEREQIANMHLLDKVYRLQRKLKGVASEGPDSPISSPAPEDSCQRQKIRESHRICATYRQHLTNLIRAFEELLQASEVDYYVAEGFREQLNQSARLFERLEHQCLYGESIEDEIAQLGGLAERLSDLEMPQKPSCLESSSPIEEAPVAKVEGENMAVVASKFHPELLMEHLQEIRMLRHQLEESIKTNERLRKQLEQQVSDTVQGQGSANVCICSSEQHNSLTSEIHFLREQNQVLNVMLAKGSRDKQKENEKLRESLSKKHLAVEQLHAECERLKKENEKLQKEARKREEENGCLTNEVYSIRNELNRLQMELNTKQRELLENDDLLHSLRLELRVYEKLDNVIRSQKDSSRDRADECRKDQNHPLDLHDLLTEIQNLRAQLEISIKANKILHDKLEEQFSSGKRAIGSLGSTVNISYLFKQESQHYAGINELKFPTADSNVLELQQRYGGSKATFKADAELTLGGLDGSAHCSLSAGKSRDPSSFPRHCFWADKNGRHVLGLVEDYNSLRKLVSEGRKLLSELELPLKEASLQEPEMTASLGRIPTAFCTIRHNLDEAACLLKLLWRVSLPMKVVHNAAYSLQDEAMRAELHRLRRKLAEQEKKLHSTVKRLHSTNQLKENMERIIIDQLALTHDVLKKARGNLELQPAENTPSAFSLSKTRVL